MTTPKTTTDSVGILAAALQRLEQLGVNVLALDFDETLISMHTNGNWHQGLEKLTPHVRPEFKDLILAALARNVHVAIVTLSCQPALVRQVLESFVGAEQAAKIPVRGGDCKNWSHKGSGSQSGKQGHIASALEELQQSCTTQTITKKTTLLIDDDVRNIRIALKVGVRGIWFDPSKPQNLLHDLANMKESLQAMEDSMSPCRDPPGQNER